MWRGWQSYLEFALGVREDSVYWCGADPGWAYGLYSAVVTPMVLGLRSVLQRGGFDVAATCRAMVDLGVTDYTAAPVFRKLRVSDVPVPDGLRLQRLSSAGEPLTAEVNEWASTALGLLVHDHYGQTELGMSIGFPHHPDVEIRSRIRRWGWRCLAGRPPCSRRARARRPRSANPVCWPSTSPPAR
ncbi:AMP-binding protein [Saccharopolyspora terrae]|uniref:AMP-binding protein n=1 Tax=Saccharopolyspora terrae TaxID=2530384 RepID=UPI0022A6A173|nr:AMP-binding protein [Saccharopolyspora terrae]